VALPEQSVVMFEAPHRIEALAAAMAVVWPARRVTVARELTKQFESVVTMAAGELPQWLAADANRQRGEFALVLHAQPAASDTGGALGPGAQRTLRLLLAELPVKQAVSLAAAISGAPRNALYEQALTWRDAQAD
jgi:16S rRNA (cytidine1402-2'-O)-methyltransferase